ncbi:MAG: ATP-binding protein [Burkholderiales bacterium]|nr:ATP-binding protein [Burkholderiales bacterium]
MKPSPPEPLAVPARPAARGASPARLLAPLAALSEALSAQVRRLGRVPGFRWVGDVRVLLTVGLVSMLVSAMLGASWLGLLPDTQRAEAESRAAFVEVLAAGSMGSLAAQDLAAVSDLLRFALERNASMRSAAVRRADGALLVAAGPHEEAWTDDGSVRSTPTRITMPLYADGRRWGGLEVAFHPQRAGLIGALLDPRAVAIALIALACAVGFYLYLGRMLTQLDPSRAVPDRVRNALDTLAEGLMLVDGEGRVVLANATLCELLGRSSEALAGRPASGLGWFAGDGGSIDAADLPWTRALAQTRPLKLQPVALTDAAGERRSFLANCAPVGGERGELPAGVLVSLDDVTELQRTEARLREATERAESANRAKSDFLANVSHEIRTPMNAVLGFTEMLRRGRVRDAAQARRHLDTIHSSGSHLLALINELLDLQKVEAGLLDLERLRFAPHAVLAEVVETLSVRAAEKGVGLRCAIDGPVPAEVLGDPSRLRQIVTNLVGNAIKFTERGEVLVTERWLADDAGRGARLRIDVADSGIGIAHDRLESIFEPFVQADSSTTRRFGGTGLGLTLSRKLARAMGGDVVASSEPGRGSTFSITIDPGPDPQRELIEPGQALAARTVAAHAEHAWRFPPRRLLVVDDSPENRELVALALQDSGLLVEQAGGGEAALAAVAREVPDLVLMDMQMPGMDGFTATRRLRALGLTVPVLAFTAHALRGFETQIHEAGCDGYLTKPIDIDVMMQTLAERLGGTRVPIRPVAGAPDGWAEALAAPMLVAAPAGPAGPAARDAGPIRSRLAGHARFAAIADAFAARLPERVARMRTVHDAGGLAALAEDAHWLKGSAGTVGFDAFTDPARRLEAAARSGDRAAVAAALLEIEALCARVATPEGVEGSR